MKPLELYNALLQKYKKQNWWPVTDSGKIAPAYKNRAKILECEKISHAKQEKLAQLIRPSGYYNQKAKKIRNFSAYLEKNYSCRTENLFSKPVQELRSELLSLNGIGNETADSIILYAAGKPVFVIDAYTKRLLQRGFGKKQMSYEEAQAFFESQLPKDAELFKEFHALIVEHSKQYCKKHAGCEECFLGKNCAKDM